MYYCDKCGKPATHLSWLNINGQRTEQHLCAECAKKERGFDEFIEPIIGEFFDFPVAFARRKPSRRVISCPVCGFTSKDFLETGRLNCPECYKYLNEVVEPAIKNFYNDRPAPIEKVKLRASALPKASEVDNLKERLRCAVAEERYEEAAALKRQIDNIEGKKEE
ncbi:MAG: hypothetical protein IJ301_03200 [Clostridia bacterium]|nr:hypothetical protein [Clostridia bacterium]